jgi:hypothetical protein
MNRTRNADEFLLKLRRIAGEYDAKHKLQIERIRRMLTDASQKEMADGCLEAHVRTYKVDALLSALNWDIMGLPDATMPNLLPEAPVQSNERGTMRFLDYLGFERHADTPLMVVETKRPNARLPMSSSPSGTTTDVILRALRGDGIDGRWKRWLGNLKDYVRSVYQQTGTVPRRVIITNGDWMIVFLDPSDAFVGDGLLDSTSILTFAEWNDLERRYSDVYLHLDYYRVASEMPVITPAESAFYCDPQNIDSAVHCIRLRYIDEPGIYQRRPVIKVAVALLVGSCKGRWMRVENPPVEYEMPHDIDRLPEHLSTVDHAAKRLLVEVNECLGKSLELCGFQSRSQDLFRDTPLVRDFGPGEYLILTGEKTHFVVETPPVDGCAYHNWATCRDAGVAAIASPVVMRSVDHHSFFMSGELYHCAHRDVFVSKRSPVTLENRARCGVDCGPDGQAFCQIWRFESFLCCDACAFHQICSAAEVLRLPCIQRNASASL